MTVQRTRIRYLIAYILLVVGSLVFSFPFVWMLTTSMKVDRELYPEKITLFPITPNALLQSPFVDQSYYRNALSDLTSPHLSIFENVLRSMDLQIPEGIDRVETIRQMARGLAKKIESLLLPDSWNLPPDQLETEIRKQVTPEILDELLDRVHRWFGFGQVRIRSYQFEEQELGKDQPFTERFTVLTPETLKMEEYNDRGTRCARLHVDFSKGSQWKLEGIFNTDFNLRNLHRIQLYVHPDDNWHRLHCYVEKLGVLYQSVRPSYPANFDWGIMTWQEPGPDDEINKIRTWTHLEEVDRGSQYLNDPHRIKITFVLERSNQLQAWWGKATINYIVTMMHLPVWRYTSTSVYLVILNILLSVLSCSMVAYSIARLTWPGRDFCFFLMLSTMMIPAQVTMIPNFLIWKWLGGYNTLVPLWLGAAFASPFSVFLLRQFLKGIPRSLEEAARIDGCGYFRVYWEVMLPLVKPTLAVIAIGAFMGTWNNFMGPLIFIADQRLYPLAFGLYAFSVQVANNPALTMAGSFLMTVPIVVVFFFAQRYFIEGVTLTGIKG